MTMLTPALFTQIQEIHGQLVVRRVFAPTAPIWLYPTPGWITGWSAGM